MTTPPTFVSGAILTASQMSTIGTWKLGSATFAAAFNLDSVFSTDYNVYVLSVTEATSAGTTEIQFRTGGTTNAGANYIGQYNIITTSLTATRYTTPTTSATVSPDIGGTSATYQIVIYDPFSSSLKTNFNCQGVAAGNVAISSSGQFNTTTSFDGFRLLRSSGTFAGTYTLYGINK